MYRCLRRAGVAVGCVRTVYWYYSALEAIGDTGLRYYISPRLLVIVLVLVLVLVMFLSLFSGSQSFFVLVIILVLRPVLQQGTPYHTFWRKHL